MTVGTYFWELLGRIRENRRVFVAWCVLRTLVVLAMVRSVMLGRWESVFVCLLTLVLLMVPSAVEHSFKVDIPPLFELIIYLFIFAAELLGEVDHFYVHIPGWDTMLHTINGFLSAAVGFSMLYLLNQHSKNISLSPLYLAMVSLCFSMTIGVCWEFIEFGADVLLGQDMQKDTIVQSFSSVELDPAHDQNLVPVNGIVRTQVWCADGQTFVIDGGYLDIGIHDTMKDLLVNFVGAVAFAVVGYGLVRNGGQANTRFSEFARGLLVRPREDPGSGGPAS